jgi:hypothetical protein
MNFVNFILDNRLNVLPCESERETEKRRKPSEGESVTRDLKGKIVGKKISEGTASYNKGAVMLSEC